MSDNPSQEQTTAYFGGGARSIDAGARIRDISAIRLIVDSLSLRSMPPVHGHAHKARAMVSAICLLIVDEAVNAGNLAERLQARRVFAPD